MFKGASTFVSQVDFAFYFITAISVVLLLIITVAMVVFTIKYHRSRHPKAENIHEHAPIEIAWTVIPTILVMIMFYYGWVGFVPLRTVPKDAMKVKVTGQTWSWSFEYENGKKSDILFAPLEKPVHLLLNSVDVLHSFYVPAFRIKEDVVPGRNNYLWFQATETGEFDIQCAEYCGMRHSYMLSKVKVINESDFSEWYNQPSEGSAGGKIDILATKGCVACHTKDGSKLVGPTFKGVFGRKESVKTGDQVREITVDEEYIKRSVYEPAADIVEGFPPVMPSQKGLVSEEELKLIIDELKELK